ncbi:hypothetical protein Lal_00021231 [Lupinus albus]|uniref:Putative EF-hand domain pair protein n=1 Tax=Lupinus albus TaxID=3870 RepID=A0A6A5MT45_LUPAL|nr:putative EF-hand domain pair protein [Lupinus albus]KAF1876517.1 hypothetical protein Lal_00021231 [Lupinus albus]
MLHSFTTCFTFLYRKVKSLFNQKRTRPKNTFSSTLDFSSTSSFLHMKVTSQLKQVFKVIDTNGDGKLSTTELSKMLTCLGGYNKCMAAKEAESMVKVLDFNGDGFVDLDDFMVFMNNNEKEDERKDKDDYLMDAFLVFDTDNNGLISPKELQRVLLILGFDNCSVRECKLMIKGVDKNGDGFVDFEEFRSMMNT